MRRLEDHLGPEELASLPESLEVLKADGTQQELLGHIAQCESCSNLIAIHYRLRALGNLPDSNNSACPSDSMWLEYVEGLIPDEGPAMLAHAAQCRACAHQLREVMSLIEPAAVEQTVEHLASSGDDWQKTMASQMAKTTSSVSRRPRLLSKLLSWSPWIAIPATAVALALLVYIGVARWRSNQSSEPSEAQLLASAYNHRRTIPLRVPAADPVPMASGTRGPGSSNEPYPLLELKSRAQKHLEESPNDAYWHQVMGEVNLLENDPVTAKRNFLIAKNYDASLPRIDADLGAAIFEIVDEHKVTESETYAEAAEYYGKALDSPDQDRSVLYFNRALCWERQGVKENALSDLEAALKAEKSEEWRKSIRAEIERLSGQSSTQDPKADHYEDDLANVTEHLLRLWGSDPHARAEIARVAAEGNRHEDRWLSDWTRAGHSPESEKGDIHLARAVEDSGNPSLSLEESRDAV